MFQFSFLISIKLISQTIKGWKWSKSLKSPIKNSLKELLKLSLNKIPQKKNSALAYSLGKINITPCFKQGIVGRCEEIWRHNKTITRRSEKETQRSSKRRKKSQILYFDIFYVDLDSNSTELYRGFFRRFRAISHECVSCYLQIPAVWYFEHEHMKWCIIFFLVFISSFEHQQQDFFSHPPSEKPHENKILFFIDIYKVIFSYVKYLSLSKVILRVLHRCLCEASNDKNRFWQLEKKSSCMQVSSCSEVHEIRYCNS